jgi:hypothetical protein
MSRPLDLGQVAEFPQLGPADDFPGRASTTSRTSWCRNGLCPGALASGSGPLLLGHELEVQQPVQRRLVAHAEVMGQVGDVVDLDVLRVGFTAALPLHHGGLVPCGFGYLMLS